MTINYASSYGAYAPDQPVGFYPGLVRFQLWVPVGGLVLWAVSVIVALRAALLSAALPALAFVAYSLALAWVAERPPGVVLDNVPNVWLFIADTAALLGLATYVLVIWGIRRGLVLAMRKNHRGRPHG